MRLGSEKDYIDLRWVSTVHETLPRAGDMSLELEVRSHGFAGGDNVWFGKEDMDQFTAALRALNKSLIGKATITDLSYGSESDGCLIELFNLDRSGHLAARVELVKPTTVGMKNFPFKLSVVFEIEPSMLERFLEEWNAQVS
jgi:hypothetical protein